ncbi:MAG: hypothetical protein DMD81_01795 [Candidatus Rokuibacteriota bacterium]|nr:MAG: hypothetical protein DMD81_01795 [Candidatus Rokubacteria bacterium]
MAAEPRDALDAAARSRVTVVIGESDTGKTSLVAALANALFSRDATVAIVDADIGQSEIGPPTTVGLGRVTRQLGRPADAEVVVLRFVGATSAARDLRATVQATGQLVDRARALGFERVIVDTSGLVRGDLGRRLKQAKIDAIAPDLVIALQRAGECEPILRVYEERADRLRVLRLPAVASARRRTAAERRRHRDQAFAAHFAGATDIVLDLSRVALRSPALFVGTPLSASELRRIEASMGSEIFWGERRGREVTVVTSSARGEPAVRALARELSVARVTARTLTDLVDVIAGLDDENRESLWLGVVRRVDFAARTMTVTTRAPRARVASVTVGRERSR